MRSLKYLVLTISFLYSSLGLAWGERGHQMLTRVASHLVEAKYSRQAPAFAQLMRNKAYMLAHLSNIPDTYWRFSPEPARSANAPTHFIDLEYLLKGSSSAVFKDLPREVSDYRKLILETCQLSKKDCAPGSDLEAKISSTGHALFRSEQLYSMLKQAFNKLAKNPQWDEPAKNQMQEALELAGLLSHFIGDLVNPMHTSKNYNGQLSGQTGLHSYLKP